MGKIARPLLPAMSPRSPLLPLGSALLLTLCAATAGHAQNLEFSVQTQRHSDATRLNEMDKQSAPPLRPRAGRNLSYEDNELRLAYRQGDWTLSALGRQSAAIVANQDGLEFARHLIDKQWPAGDRRFDLELDYRGFAGGGLALARRFKFGDAKTEGGGWSARLELQALSLKRLRHTEVWGSANFNAARRAYAFDLQAMRAQDGMDFTFQQNYPSTGWGLLGQAELQWCGARACVAAAWQDLGRLVWKRLPQEALVLNSETHSYDADGYLVYKPMLNGRYSQPRYSSSARQRLQLRGHYDSDWGRSSLQLTHLQGFGWLPELGLGWNLAPGGISDSLGLQGWGLRWASHERRLSLDLQGRRWRLSWGSDRLSGSEAHSRQLSLAWIQPL